MKTNTHLKQRLLVFAAILAIAASSLQAQEPIPQEILQAAAPNEPFFIEIDHTARRAESFPAEFLRLKESMASNGAAIQEQWVGPMRFYLVVRLPQVSIAGRNELIAKLAKLPGVRQVISASSANVGLTFLDEIQKFDGSTVVPEAKLRGFRDKMVGFRPDTRAPHKGEIIVKYLESESDTPAKLATCRENLSAIRSSHAGRVRTTMTLPDGGVLDVIELPRVIDFDAAIQAYNDSPFVEYAEPNYIGTTTATPNDPLLGNLWAMPKISASSAWDTRTSAGSTIVAVTDTGIDYSHPDIAGNMWVNPNPVSGYDGLYGRNCVDPANRGNPMDDHSYLQTYHGTHVAGTIGAVGNNGIGVPGVAWSVKLMAVRVMDSGGFGDVTWFADGINYARQKGAHIINASWRLFGASATVEAAIMGARNAGVIFVNAAGNSAYDIDVTPFYPARYNMSNMLVVGASDQSDLAASFSNRGRWGADLFAPGVGILSTKAGNQYQSLNGTSMAAPHVSGMLALAKAQFPSESWRELVERARFSIDGVGALDSLSMSGGRLNLAKALGTRPRLVNLSTRCQVNSPPYEIAVAGIAIGGTAPKVVAFRAQGPTLGNYQVPNPLQNPQITIFNGSGQVIGSNDDWGTLSTADKAILASAAATPFDPLESAWVGTLAPGAYTVHLSGVGGGTGVAIIEAFDADGSTQNRLINVSTRCYVGTGIEVAIAGTVVVGDKPRIVYIRALGPTLGSVYQIPGSLQDPVITLFKNGVPNAIASSNDWGGSGTAFGNRLVQNGNPPLDYRESALIARLDPNSSYTVHLSGNGGTTGVGIIEVYEF